MSYTAQTRSIPAIPHAEAIGLSAYYAMIATWTMIGLGSAGLMAWMTIDDTISWPMFIGAFVVEIIGVIIATSAVKKQNVEMAVLGYALVALPMGALTGPILAHYTTVSIVKVLAITASMVVGLGAFGLFYPKSLASWGAWLFGALWVSIIGYLIVPIAGYFGAETTTAMTWLDWGTVALFCGIIVFDFNQAARRAPTPANAILVALEIFLDFVNVFLRLLRLLGERK